MIGTERSRWISPQQSSTSPRLPRSSSSSSRRSTQPLLLVSFSPPFLPLLPASVAINSNSTFIDILSLLENATVVDSQNRPFCTQTKYYPTYISVLIKLHMGSRLFSSRPSISFIWWFGLWMRSHRGTIPSGGSHE